jgi:simple sugar transport system permease protein
MTLASASVVAARRTITVERRVVIGGLLVVLGLLDALVFGYLSPPGHAVFSFTLTGAAVSVPNLSVTPRPVCVALGALSCVIGAGYVGFRLAKVARRVAAGVCVTALAVAFLCWADAGRIPLPFTSLLSTTVDSAIPLMLGALSGCLCERSGVINVAIEGQLLTGAFGAAVVASAFGSIWLGLLAGPLCGVLIAALLGLFALRYRVDQIVLGIVLDLFASGITAYLYDAALVPFANRLNSPATFGTYKIPLLGDIPIIGPVLFDSTIFLYITYVAIFAVQVGLFSTRWGLRVRSVGEHPTAADTVGINVNATRWRNVLLGGAVAGIGGAYLTIGSVGAFGKTMSSGLGFIALAAMIFGRWTPLGGVAAALLFGFMSALSGVLGTINSPIPSDVLLMFPYVATIVAVAGLVGRGRPPKADGQPYIKT